MAYQGATIIDDTNNDSEPQRFVPTSDMPYHKKYCTCFRCAEREAAWQNEGHKGISEDFSSDKTPQERLDENLV